VPGNTSPTALAPPPGRYPLRSYSLDRIPPRSGTTCGWRMMAACVTDRAPIGLSQGRPISSAEMENLHDSRDPWIPPRRAAMTTSGFRESTKRLFRSCESVGRGSARYLQHLGFPALATTSAGSPFRKGCRILTSCLADRSWPYRRDYRRGRSAGHADFQSGTGFNREVLTASRVVWPRCRRSVDEDSPANGRRAL